MAESVLGQNPIEKSTLDNPTMPTPGTTGSDLTSMLTQLHSKFSKSQEPTTYTDLPSGVSNRAYNRLLGEEAPLKGVDVSTEIADAQSGLEQISMGLGRVGTKVLTELAKMPGSAYAIADWATGEEFGAAFNNSWLAGLERFNEEVNEKGLPVFQSEKYTDGNIFDKLATTSFWATEGADGVGFLVSMMAPGAALRFSKFGEAMAGVGKAAEVLNMADKSADAANVISKSANLAQDASKLARLSTKLETSSQLLANRINDIGATAVNTTFEAVEEGRGAYNDYLAQNPTDYEGAAKAGRNTMVQNIGVLAASNWMDQKWLFGGAKKLAGKAVTREATDKVTKEGATKLLGESMGKAADLSSPIAKLSLASKIGEGAWGAAKGFAKEGFFEEGIQTAISQRAQSESSWNPLDVMETYLDFITAPLGSKANNEMWSGIILGGILGAPMSVYGDYKQNEAIHKQAEDYRKLLAEDYTAHTKSLRELAVTVNGVPQYMKDKNGKNTTVYDLDKEKVKAQGEKIARVAAMKQEYFTAIENGNEEQARYVLDQLDFEYARKWLTIDGGEALLRKHIDHLSKVKAKQELDEKGFNTKTENEIRDEFVARIPAWKEMIDKLNDTHDLTLQHLLGAMPEGATKDMYEEFRDHLMGVKMSARVDLIFGEKRAKENLSAIESLSENSRYQEVLEKNRDLLSKLDIVHTNDKSEGKTKVIEELNRIIKEVKATGALDALDQVDFERKLDSYFRDMKLATRAKETLKRAHDSKVQKTAFSQLVGIKKAFNKISDKNDQLEKEKQKTEARIKDPDVEKLRQDNTTLEEIPTYEEIVDTDDNLKTGFIEGTKRQIYHRARKKIVFKNRETGVEKEVIVVIGDPVTKAGGSLSLRVVEENEVGDEIKREMMYLKSMNTILDSNDKAYDVVSITDYKSLADIKKRSQERAVISVYQKMIDSYDRNIKGKQEEIDSVNKEFTKHVQDLEKLEEKHPTVNRKKKPSVEFPVKLLNKVKALKELRDKAKEKQRALKQDKYNLEQDQLVIKQDLDNFRKNPEFPLDTLTKLIKVNSDMVTIHADIVDQMDELVSKNDNLIRNLLPLVKSYSKSIAKLVDVDLSSVRKQEEGEDDLDYYLEIYDDLLSKVSTSYDTIMNNLSKFPGWGFIGDEEYENKEYVYRIAIGVRDKIRDAVNELKEAKLIKEGSDVVLAEAKGNLKTFKSRYNRIVDAYSKQYEKYFKEKDAYDLELAEAEEAEINMEEHYEGALENYPVLWEEEELHPYEGYDSFFTLSSRQEFAENNEDVARWFVFVNNYAWQNKDTGRDEPNYVLRTFTYDQATKLPDKVKNSLKFYVRTNAKENKGEMLTIAQVEERGLQKEASKDIKVIVVDPKSNKFVYVNKYGEFGDKKNKAENVIFSSLGEANLRRNTDKKSDRFSFEKAYKDKRDELEEAGLDVSEAKSIVDAEVQANLEKYKTFRDGLLETDEQQDLYIHRIAPGHKEMEDKDGKKIKPVDLADGINVPLKSLRFHVSTAKKEKAKEGEEQEKVVLATELIPGIGEATVRSGFAYIINKDHPELIKPVTLGETEGVDDILNLLRYIASGAKDSNEVLDYVKTVIAMQNFKGDESDKGRIFFYRKTKKVKGKIQAEDTFDKLYFGNTSIDIDKLAKGDNTEGEIDELKAFLTTKYWNLNAALLNHTNRFNDFTEYKAKISGSKVVLTEPRRWKKEQGGYVAFLFSREAGNKSKGKILIREVPKGEHSNFLVAQYPQYSNRALYTSPDKIEGKRKARPSKQETVPNEVDQEIIDRLGRNIEDIVADLVKSSKNIKVFNKELLTYVLSVANTPDLIAGVSAKTETNGSVTIELKNNIKLKGLPNTIAQAEDPEFISKLILHYIGQIPSVKKVAVESKLTANKPAVKKVVDKVKTEDDKLKSFKAWKLEEKDDAQRYVNDAKTELGVKATEEEIEYRAAELFEESLNDKTGDNYLEEQLKQLEDKPIIEKKAKTNKKDEPPFAKLADKPIGSYTYEQQKNINWLKRTFPNFPIESIHDLIEGDKWGQFLNGGKVLLSDYAEIGTAFHEGYHVWSKLFNSDAQQKVLYDAVRKVTGQNLTDREAEEWLADNFRDYMVLGDKYEFAKEEEPIKNWFEKLLSYIREFATGFLKHLGININITPKSSINVIANAFKSLENGIFVDPINTTTETFNKIEGISTKKEIALIKDMSARFFREIVSGLNEGNDLILSVDKSTDDIYSSLLLAYRKIIFKERESGRTSVYVDLVKNWDALREKHKENLIQYGINLLEEENEEDDMIRRDNYNDSIRTAMKDNAKAPIKLLIAALPSVRRADEENRYGTQSNVQFDKMMNTLYNELQGLTTMDDMMNKMQTLRKNHPELGLLMLQLAGPTKVQNFLRNQFFNTFATNKNKVEVQVISNDNTRLHSNLVEKVDRESIKKAWLERAQKLATNKESAYVTFKNGDYFINVVKLKTALLSLSESNLRSVLKNLGMVDGLLDSSVDFAELMSNGIFTQTINKLRSELPKNTNEIFLTDLFVPGVLDIQSRINAVADIAVKNSISDRELMYFNMDNNMEWSITKNSHASNIKNRLERLGTIGRGKPVPRNLRHVVPFNGKDGNLFTMHSKWYKELTRKLEKDEKRTEIEYFLIKGTTTAFGEGEELKNTTNHEFKANSFEEVLHNKVPLKRSADRGPEQAIKVGETNFKLKREFFVDDMKDYIKDELITSFAIRSGSKKFGNGIRYYENNVRELRTFGFIYDPKFKGSIELPTIDEFLKGQKKSSLAVGKNLISLTDRFVEENKAGLEKIFNSYIDYLIVNTKQSLLDSRIIIEANEKSVNQSLYVFPGLNKNTLTERTDGFGITLRGGKKIYGSDLERVLLVHSYNYFVGITEQQKLIFGDPAFYNNHQELDKRTTSSLSSYVLTPNDSRTIGFLNQKPTRANNYSDYRKVNGYEHTDRVRKIILPDLRNTRKYDFLEEISKDYGTGKIIDGQMWGTLDFIRSTMIRNGRYEDYKYSSKLVSHEMTFQYEMQGLVIRVLEDAKKDNPQLQGIWTKASMEMFTDPDGVFYKHTGGVYTGYPMYNGVKIEPYSEKHMKLMGHFPAIKSIGAGTMANEDLNVSPHSINKMSVAPIIPSLLSDKALRFVLSMMEHDIDKFGDGTTEKSAAYINDINIENGDLITKDHLVSEMLYDDYGVQLDIKLHEEKEVTDSTQKNTTLYNDVYDKGTLLIKDLEKDIIERDELLNELDRRHMEEALNDLGIKKSNNTYHLADQAKFEKELRKMIFNRLLPENLKDGLHSIFKSKTKMFDLVSDNKKMHSITIAYIRNNVVKRKVNGRMLVQEASYLYTLGEEPLRFYREAANGGLLTAEVMIPLFDALIPYVNQVGGLDNFNEMLKNNELPKEIKYFVSNRVPTSRPNTIEAFTVRKFIPNYAGARIILPYEIVAKTSSDFDIDKLTSYFNNFKVPREENGKYSIEVPTYNGTNSESEAIENRLNELTARAILHKDRKRVFLNPHSSDKLEEVAREFYVPATHLEKIEAAYTRSEKEAKGKKEFYIQRWHSAVEWWYNSKKALDFLDGIRGVSQAASQNVVHTQLQKNPIPLEYDVPLFFEGQKRERTDWGQTDSGFTRSDGEQYINGHVKDSDNFDVSETYEQTLVSFVDVAKKPFIINLLSNLDTYNVLSFLNRFGLTESVGIKQIAAFISNPVVREYILQSNIAKSPFANNNMYIDQKIPVDDDYGKTTYVSDGFDEKYFGYKSNIYERLTKGDYNETVTKALQDYMNNPSDDNYIVLQGRIEKSGYSYLSMQQLQSTSNYYKKQLVDNYMMYELLARKNVNLNSVLRPYASTSFGKSLEEINERKLKRENLVKSGAFLDANIQSTIDHSQIREIHKVYQDTVDAFGWTNVLFKYPNLGEFYNSFLNDFRKMVYSKEDIADLSSLIKSHLLTFFVSYNEGNYSDTKKLYNELFISDNSVVKQLADLKASNKISNELFTQLRPVFKEWAKDLGRKRDNSYLTMYNKKYGLDMDNILKGEFESLFESSDKQVVEFARKLSKLAIFQSGLRNSSNSFHSIIPNNYFVPFMDTIISDLAKKSNDFDINDFDVWADLKSFTDQFYRNNYMNTDVVPRARKAIYITEILTDKTDLDDLLTTPTKPLYYYPNSREGQATYLTVRMNKESKQEIKENYKNKKKSEVEYLLFKKDETDINKKGKVGFKLVGKLGDGSRMVEYYPVVNGDSIPSVISSNNYNAKSLNISETEQSFSTKTDVITFTTSRKGISIPERYKYRTIENAQESDVTIALAYNFNSAGEKLTRDTAIGKSYGSYKAKTPEKYIPVDLNSEPDIELIVDALNKLKPTNISINIAGNSIYSLTKEHKISQPKIDSMILDILEQVISNPRLKKKVKLIRSGGQTGVDESGIKAGIKLGIPVLIHAPKNWLVRNSDKEDVDLTEQKFKERFIKIGNKTSEITTDNTSAKQGKLFQLEEETIQPEVIEELNMVVKDYLQSIGVTTKPVETIKDITGTVVPAIAVADLVNMTIDVVEGKMNLKSLPEEAAHFYVSMLDENSGLYKSMYDNIIGYSIYSQVVSKYGEKYEGNEKKLREEAMGKLIAERMTAGFISNATDRQQSQATNWWVKLWSVIKDLLIKSKTDPYAKAAYDILTKNVTNLKIQDETVESITNEETSLEEQWSNLSYPIKAGTIKYSYYRTTKEADSAYDSFSRQFGKDMVVLIPMTGDVNYKAKIAIKKPRSATNTIEKIVEKENNSVHSATEMAKNPIGFNWELAEANFESYFPDYKWMSQEERLSLLRSIDRGETELACSF